MPGSWIEVGVWLLVGLVAALVAFVVFLIWRDGYVKGWRAARRLPPLCPDCGYNLSGLVQTRCPECGQQHELGALLRAVMYVPGNRTERAVE